MFLQQQAYVANIVQFECFPISWTQTPLFVCILSFSKHSRRLLLAKIAHILFQLQQCLMLTLCVFELLPLFIYNKRHLLKSACALLIAYCRAYQGFSVRLVSVDSLLFLVPYLLQCVQGILFDSLLSKVSRCSDEILVMSLAFRARSFETRCQ